MASDANQNNIRVLRFQYGEMIQKELAQQVGVTKQTSHAIEVVKYGPFLELVFRIARVFDASVEEVFNTILIKRGKGVLNLKTS